MRVLSALPGLVLALLFEGLSQETKPPSAEEARFQLDVFRQEARKPFAEFQAKYDQALERLATAEQKKGNLEAVLAIREERKQFRSRESEPEKSGHPSLENLRTIYRQESDRLLAEIAASDIKLLKNYLSHLEIVVQALTRKGELEEALKVRGQIEATAREINDLKSGTIQPAIDDPGGPEEIVLGTGGSFEKNGQIEVRKDGSVFVLTGTGNKSRAESQRTYKPPFRIQARVATDSTNIRFYFCQKGVVIFNWERKKSELRVHNPVLGKNFGIKGQGEVDTGEMHDLEIEVTEKKVRVYANRRKRGEIEGDFAAAEGKIGLGPAFGSTLTVESFKGIQDEGDSR